LDLLAARDARDPETSGDDRRVARRPSAGRENAFGMQDAVHVVRRSLDPDQDHRLPFVPTQLLRLIRIEGDDSHRGAGGRVEASREEATGFLRLRLRLVVELGQEQVDHVVRFDAQEGLLLRDEPLADHVEGDPHRRPSRGLGGPRLEHP